MRLFFQIECDVYGVIHALRRVEIYFDLFKDIVALQTSSCRLDALQNLFRVGGCKNVANDALEEWLTRLGQAENAQAANMEGCFGGDRYLDAKGTSEKGGHSLTFGVSKWLYV